MIEVNNKQLKDFIFYSVRYACGKQDHLVEDVAGLVSRYTNALSENEKAILKKYILDNDDNKIWDSLVCSL